MTFGKHLGGPLSQSEKTASSNKHRMPPRQSGGSRNGLAEKAGVFRSKPSEAGGEPRSRKGEDQRLIRQSSAEKAGVFRSKPSEAGGESPGAYFP